MADHATAPLGDAVHFGPFRLVPAERLLLRGAEPVQIGSRALDILIALVEAAGDVVSQKELVSRAWPNVVVGDGSLRVTIAELRKLLGDGKDGVRYVANVTGRGYCFVAAVESPPAGATAIATATAPPPVDAEPRYRLPSRLLRMVGRKEAIASLSDLLITRRFVSIVGPGGMGKTTIAVTLAHVLLGAFPQGAYFVDFGAITDPGLVVNTLAAELGLSVTTADALPSVIGFLAQRKVLLVLDNCEHVIEAAASLAEQIYSETSQVHILTTAREALRVEGEQVYLLSPLDCPWEKPCLTAQEAMASPAVQLFMDRAFASGHSTPLTDLEAPIVAAMCGRLDGIALAIELAGSRVGAYGLQGTSDLLSNRFKLFWQGRRSAPPRHQTLHAMLDWSFNLLSERDRCVLSRLSVFVGSFTLDAAQAVVGDAHLGARDVGDAVAGLVAKSLISVSQAQGIPVYRLLESTSQFAAEKLAQHCKANDVARRHALHYTDWCARVAPNNYLRLGHGVLAAIEPSIGNVRAALEWSFSGEGNIKIGVQLAATAAPFFFELSSPAECRRWCEAGLAALPVTDLGDRVRLTLQATLAAAAMFTIGNAADVRQSIEDCLTLADALGDTLHQLHLLAGLQMFHVRSYDSHRSSIVAQRCMLTAQLVGTAEAKALAELVLGVSHHIGGDQAGARFHFERGLAQAAGVEPAQMVFFGYDHRICALQFLARVLWLSGFPDRAAAIAQTAVNEAKAQNQPVMLCMSLIYASTVYLWNGKLDQAEALIGELMAHASTYSLRPYNNVGLALSGEVSVKRGDMESGLSLLRQALGMLEDKHYYTLCLPIHSAIIGGLIVSGRDTEAQAYLELALSRPYATANDKYMPELLRLQGELYERGGAPSLAQDTFERAISTAKAQSALSFELRSTMSLARLWASTGRGREAAELLQDVYRRFTEGFETTDLRAARDLLKDLSYGASALARMDHDTL